MWPAAYKRCVVAAKMAAFESLSGFTVNMRLARKCVDRHFIGARLREAAFTAYAALYRANWRGEKKSSRRDRPAATARISMPRHRVCAGGFYLGFFERRW